MTEKAFHPVASIFPLLAGEDYEKLKNDIAENGLLEAIWIHPEDESIIDGRNRYRACLELGIEPEFRTWGNGSSPIDFVVSTNLHRRHLDTNQKAMAAAEAMELYKAEAKERQGARTDLDNIVEIFPPSKKGKSRDKAAEKFGTNGKYVDAAVKLKKEEPELADDVKAGKITIPEAKALAKLDEDTRKEVVEKVETGESKTIKAATKKVKKEKQIQAIETTVWPEGQYHVIAIDPPWQYESRKDDETHRAANPYPDMTVEEIKALDIPGLALDDCILWLWTTNAFMEQAHQIAHHWGFEVKTILTWVKNKMGTGDWLRGKTEHCLMCVKGKPVVNLTNQTTVIEGPLREHSRKPDEFYRLVGELCPGQKVDIFSREEREGWEAHGNETKRFK